MVKRLTVACCGLALLGAMACGEGADVPDEEPTGVQMATEVPEASDVTHMKYTLYEAECPPPEQSMGVGQPPDPGEKIGGEAVQLKDDLTLPSGIPRFVDEPFDEESSHRFGDFFRYLDAGCYTVHAEPYTKTESGEKNPSGQCLPVYTTLEVVAGEVTEELLISQCDGSQNGKGALDVIAAMNNPPEIEKVDLDPQKFNECPVEGYPEIETCVKAGEPDRDPMKMELWRADKEGNVIMADGRPVRFDTDVEGVRSISYQTRNESPGALKKCATVTYERSNQAYNAVVAVFDQLHDRGELVTFEKWFERREISEEGAPLLSRATQHLTNIIGECSEDRPLCNETTGYWRHLPHDDVVEERWSHWTDYVPFGQDAEELCEDEDWIEILRTTGSWSGLYYRVARAYVTASLNYAAFGWNANLSEMGDILAALGDYLIADDRCEPDPGHKTLLVGTSLEDAFDEAVLEKIETVTDRLGVETPTDLGELQELINDHFNDHLCRDDVPVIDG